MAEIQPFRAYRYDTNRVALERVLTQPYDKITPEMQEHYYAASPYNLIAIEKGKILRDDSPQENAYTRAARKAEEWIAQKILLQDSAPSIYVYSQEYSPPETQTRRIRTGFIALGRIEDYDAQVVFRHERTLSAPKADRIELLRHTHLQTGQLFLLYDDPARRIETALEGIVHAKAPNELRDEYGVTHRLWPVSDPAFIAKIQREMAGKKLVIADGHHRYESALQLRNEGRKQLGKIDPLAAHEFAMMAFVNSHSRGLTILPTHRLIQNLTNFDFEKFRAEISPWFDWYAYPFSNDDERASSFAEFRRDMENQHLGRRAIGAYAGRGAFYLFVLSRGADLEEALPHVSDAQRGLDVVLLHRLVLEKGLGISAEAVAAEKNVTYEREMDDAIATVDRGNAQITFLLNPVRVQQVMDIALGGNVLPQKSTDFYPKLLSGVAIYRAEGRITG
ncbi:MAG: DUF1015 domain-containing protein [Candidatus Acidiferrales bacterium]